MRNEMYPLDPGDALLIHASSVRVGDSAFIFLGPSGTGKSTVRRLLDGFSESVADDVAYLVPQSSGGWMVVDAGGHRGVLSATEIMACEGTPLRAIFRLNQAKASTIKRVDPLETCRFLTQAFFEVKFWLRYDNIMREKIFYQLAKVAREVPGYRFHFDRSDTTVQVFTQAMMPY